VSNVSLAASQEELLNLFGFCGYVSGIKLTRDPLNENLQIAIVEFWDKNAVTTACLLSSAVVQGQPIQVELYLADEGEQRNISDSNIKTAGTPPPPNADPAAKQSKTAVMARVLASGIRLADDVKTKAIAWDTGNLTIIQKLEALGTVALHQAELINEKYHLSEKKDEFVAAAEKKALEIKAIVDANQNVQIAKAKVSEIDNKYGISTKAVGLFEQAKQKAHELKEETKLEIARKAELAKSRQA
jgi:putative ubiquitin-RnfH superfamily antitoxin RatB of RatAB toxin-antitoxin module